MYIKSSAILATLGILSLIASVVSDKTFLVGSSVRISCRSNIAPMWHWTDSKNGRDKILAVNGVNPHPNLEDQRYEFTNQNSEFSLLLTNVQSSDAGTFTCLGDSTFKTLVNVVR